MRLVCFRHRGRRSFGVRLADRVVELEAASGAPVTGFSDLIGSGAEALSRLAGASDNARGAAVHDPATLEYLPLADATSKVICLGMNYLSHVKETGQSTPEHPVVFLRAWNTLVGHDAPIILPRCSSRLDYEGEMVAYVGRRARHVPQNAALDIIAGDSVFNDASLRDFQLRTTQYTLGKNFDATGAVGPVFVSADELPPGGAGLRLRTRLNGETVQDGDTADMIFDVARAVAILTEVMTLEPGDLLVMGTPAGVGLTRSPPRWMAAGDVCEVDLEGVGVLRNTIVAERSAHAGA